MTPAPICAQSAIGERVSIEFAGAINTTSQAVDDPFLFLDLTATARITDALDVVVRPWVRRLPGGDWSKEMYQLQIRYQPATAIPLRIDAGIIASPLGLVTLEMRPDRNPVIGNPSYYFSPLPSFDGRFDRVPRAGARAAAARPRKRRSLSPVAGHHGKRRLPGLAHLHHGRVDPRRRGVGGRVQTLAVKRPGHTRLTPVGIFSASVEPAARLAAARQSGPSAVSHSNYSASAACWARGAETMKRRAITEPSAGLQ